MRACCLPIIMALALSWGAAWAQPAPGPFAPDEHTLLLYHFDEGEGTVAHDASGRGQDGLLKGAQWAKGKFGGGLWFDGTDDSVFLEHPDALRNLPQITVECWFNQEATWGRRFLVGHDVGFHFEVDDAAGMSISLYNQGGAVNNAEGKPHQQVAMGGVSIRPGRWHHLAITYNGREVAYFLDGVLRGRRTDAPKDFLLGAQSRGLWVGCYVDMDYYFSGLIDEVRVSDVVRYDPEGALQPGGKVFDMPQPTHPLRAASAVRTPQTTGQATLKLTLKQLWGDSAEGWVCLKPPGKPAAIVGQYQWTEKPAGPVELSFDVSDEATADGTYLVGLKHVKGWYYALTAAELVRAGKTVGKWTGEARVRWTFQPPVLAAVEVGPPRGRSAHQSAMPSASHAASRAQVSAPTDGLLLLPADADWVTGALELDPGEAGETPLMLGDGSCEWWLHVPEDTIYRVHLRYAAAAARPCDIVIDGDDLNDYNMCALNVTGRSTARDAFWEYQGTVSLKAGTHWLRLQDVLPDVVALWLEPTDRRPERKVPWARFSSWDTLPGAADWQVHPEFGDASGRVEARGEALVFAAEFRNTDPGHLFAGDRVRFTCPGKWDLEPCGRLDFTFQGTGSGHVAALSAVDAKGDEKLLWRHRDTQTEPVEVAAPLNFEGNNVFDPARVVALCLDLDEGNEQPATPHSWQVTLGDLAFVRRDVLAEPPDLRERQRTALQAVSAHQQRLLPLTYDLTPAKVRRWARPVIPEQHPLFAATEPRPVTRATMGMNLEFTGARDISAGAMKSFHEDYDFGRVCWPHIGILPQRRNFQTDEQYQAALAQMEERLRDVERRGLWLFDIWGYVPFGEAGPTPRVEPEHHAALLRVFGHRFLGYDNGEQDGRYIGSYADRGSFTDRRGGWEDFVKWDEGICNDSMNYMNATGSLNYSHYYGERGARMLGLETAQGLPSDTLMFAFLRGASKQYGRLTYQATSIWNRFGYNMYHERRTEGGGGYGQGPHKGCSLSLHKRLFFQSYTGGDSIVGTETAQFTGDQLPNGAQELSPLGRQHLEIKEWVEKHPDRGVLFTPVAFMLDFYNGWNMPRHLYRSDKYKIWGKLPYEKEDYAIDQFFRLVWPGYEDCSYLRNERGFITPTPYGDIFDVVTNRCRPDILKQYTTLILLGEVEITPEVAANLEGFVRDGGDVWVDARGAAQLPAALTGLTLGEQAQACTTAWLGNTTPFAERPYTYTVATLAGAQPKLINEAGHPVITVQSVGEGRVFVCLADHWMTDRLEYAEPKLVNMEPPYRLLKGVERYLDYYLRQFLPVTVEPAGLNVRVNCYGDDPQRLLVSLTNNELFADWEGQVRLRSGTVTAVRDLRREQALEPAALSKMRVPAGDVALLDVRVE
ncbi:MAG: hypothetical protein HPY69_09620 [Armatimonadetes bacterium]|nr:hypothetical protein [Armatimonadota bacterium]